jgi:fibronectin-binding autotransporter adhesin
VVFNAGTWEVKGVVAALGSSSITGSLNVNNGRVILGGANTFTQALNVNAGVLDFRAANNLGAGTSSIRLGQTTTSGTLRFTGNSDATISRLIRIGNGATTGWTGSAIIENTGSGVLTFNNSTFNEVGTTAAGVNRTLTLGGTHVGNNTISGVIANNNPGLVSLVKNGSGKWILSGTNTYTGDTMVNDGTLLVNNTSGSATGAGNITVQSGARLGGTGSISGNVTVPVGGGFVFALATSAAAHDRLDVGPVTLSGASSVLITASAAPGTGTYTLLRSTSALSGTLPSLTLPGGFIGALTFNGTDLQLTLSAVPFANWATQHGLTGADALATADPDFDGLQNLIEYAVGTSPSSSTSTPWMITTASGYLTLSIIKSTAASGVTWSAQSSGDLVTWQSSDTTTLTNDASTFSARDNFPVATQPRRFLRLKVTTP